MKETSHQFYTIVSYDIIVFAIHIVAVLNRMQLNRNYFFSKSNITTRRLERPAITGSATSLRNRHEMRRKRQRWCSRTFELRPFFLLLVSEEWKVTHWQLIFGTQVPMFSVTHDAILRPKSQISRSRGFTKLCFTRMCRNCWIDGLIMVKLCEDIVHIKSNMPRPCTVQKWKAKAVHTASTVCWVCTANVRVGPTSVANEQLY